MIAKTRKAVVIFSRIPELSRRMPDEPYAGLPWTDLDSLYSAMFDDVLETANSLDSVNVFVLKSEQDYSNEFLNKHMANIQILEFQNTSLNEQIRFAFETLFARQYEHIVLLLEPNPLTTKQHLHTAFELLQYDDDAIVIGQSGNGNYYLIGLKSNHTNLFESNGQLDTLSEQFDLLEKVCENEIMIFPMPTTYTLDTGTNLQRLKLELEELAGGNGFSHHTRTMFRAIDKKYKTRRFR